MIDNTMSLANAQYKVHEVKPLQSKQFKKDADVAKDLLDRACWQVQPIMKKRKWSVPVVAEMPPKNTGPIGVNYNACLLYTSPSPRDVEESRMPSSA